MRSSATKLLQPPEVGGVKLMSFGFVAKGASEGKAGAALVRGPVASTTVQQLAAGTGWGALDFLIVDMPPGTGDIMLTLCQSVGLTGAVLVTTPGKLAAADTLKGVELLHQTNIPIFALVENLSYFEEPGTGVRHRLFGASHAAQLAESARLRLHAPSEGASGAADGVFELPIEPELGASLERGTPLVLSSPGSATARAFGRLAEYVAGRALADRHAAQARPDVRFRRADGAVVLRFLSGPREGQEVAVPAATLRAQSLDALTSSQRAKAAGAEGAEGAAGGASAAAAAAAAAVHPLEISPRGNYGVAIRWSDGHESAIYPYEQILELAEAEAAG